MVAPDQRGFDLTDTHGPHDAFTLAGDVARLVRTLAYKSATIVGHDAGGAVAWVFGARYADMAVGLIVCNAPHPSAAG